MTHLERMNRQMQVLISDHEKPPTASLNDKLSAILEEGLVELQNCIVLARFKDSASHVTVADCHDETGYECFLNHLHIGDYAKGASLAEQLGQGQLFMSELARMLKTLYPHFSFQLILSCSESECTVRFHKLRANQNWVGDLEGYKEEALFLITVPAS